MSLPESKYFHIIVNLNIKIDKNKIVSMSRLVRLWLVNLGLYDETTHEDRLEIDREIEKRTGVNCDEALERGLISINEFLEIVNSILKKKRLRRREYLVQNEG